MNYIIECKIQIETPFFITTEGFTFQPGSDLPVGRQGLLSLMLRTARSSALPKAIALQAL
jgi:hypothetical protein